MKIGLSLSGGGFRATLFHLGVIEALRHQGVLGRVTEVSGVSGGSIMAAHLVQHWDRYNGSQSDYRRIRLQVIRLCQRNVRTKVVLGRAACWLTVFPLAFKSMRTGPLLETQYRRALFGETRFRDLPESPRLSILATSLTTGQAVSFEQSGWMAFPRYPHLESASFRNDIRLSWGVAASAAFPILSTPLQLESSVRRSNPQTADDRRLLDHIDLQLTDGGVYDNLGAIWLGIASPQRQSGPLDLLLISNAGRPFRWQMATDPSPSVLDRIDIFRRNVRANDLLTWRLQEYDEGRVKGFVRDSREFRIDGRYPATPNTPSDRQQVEAAQIRTDLNRFTYPECSLLRRHGACVALQELTRRPIP